jgi:hypothetical protein
VRKPFSVTVLALVMILASSAAAQRNEFTGIIGRSFISDKGVTGVVSADNILHSGKGLTLEANYGRRLMNLGIAGLTFEVPFAVNFNEKPHFDVNLVPKDYKAFFVTPSLRANIFPEAGLSPWVSVGGVLAISWKVPRWSSAGPIPARPGPLAECSRSVEASTQRCGAFSAYAEKCGIFSRARPN